MNNIYVLPKWLNLDRDYRILANHCQIIDTTSSSTHFGGLSPFILGPCATYLPGVYAKNFENLWQYSKVYSPEHIISGNYPLMHNNEWYKWRSEGWANPKAVRYPMGKGRKPAFLHWKGQNLDYVKARKEVYAMNYFANVIKTDSFKRLELLFRYNDLILLDYDAYDHREMGRTLVDVINDPNKKCGHAFILAMILTGVLPDCVE
ncbi:MAG: hypothetical protein WCY09_10185 [Candidatus Omnitrophota bacterium]